MPESSWLPGSLEEFRNSPSGKGVAGRAEVQKLAEVNPSQALAVARRIEHPWYRCQALTSVVEANPSYPSAENLLDEALGAAYSQEEPNRVASVAFWPLKLLVKINLAAALEHTQRLVRVIAREPHGLRRLDGQSAILRAVLSSDQLRPHALEPFRQTANVSFGWRSERIVDSIVQALAPVDLVAAKELLASRAPSRYNKHSRAFLSRMSLST